MNIPALARNSSMLLMSTAALAGGVMLAGNAATGDKPAVNRLMLAGVGTGSLVGGTALLRESAARVMGGPAKSAPMLVAAGLIAGIAGAALLNARD